MAKLCWKSEDIFKLKTLNFVKIKDQSNIIVFSLNFLHDYSSI